ncbi:helix-turn-helix domain-containing protein [Streptomyces sp. NPDC048696]|uniref:helix-turn-helix domain-containing protein n=1 Tax=Streptomyces sp. NPDC048696 TaxID=3365585 RepID=UPI0037153C59
MTTAQHPPGETDHPAEDPAAGEDLAALLERALADVGRNQKELAEEAGIKYPTLNAWMNRTRGWGRVDPEVWRSVAAALKKWGSNVTTADVFRAAGRAVPGPAEGERETRLLELYRRLPVTSQRALIACAEAMVRGVSP